MRPVRGAAQRPWTRWATVGASTVACGAIAWYLGVQTLWFSQKLKVSRLAGFGQAVLATFLAMVMFVVLAKLII